MGYTDRATPIKKDVLELGRELGFATDDEISETFLSVAKDNEYTPRVDVVWYLDLQDLDLNTEGLAEYFGFETDDEYRRFPFVAWEIEASDCNTKEMEADLANLQSFGAPFGFLVVNEDQNEGLYRRGKRIVRTVRELYGHVNHLCIDREHISDLVNRSWTETANKPNVSHKVSQGRGGENKWTQRVRRNHRQLGKDLGFIVKEDWLPDDLGHMYDYRKELWDETNGQTDHQQYMSTPYGQQEPFTGRGKGWTSYYTRSAIDVWWTIPYPDSLRSFLATVTDLDPDFQTHTPLLRHPDDRNGEEGVYPFAGFEIENSPSKHAGGGIVNLGAYSTIGQVLVDNKEKKELMENRIRTYERAFGVRNVTAEEVTDD